MAAGRILLYGRCWRTALCRSAGLYDDAMVGLAIEGVADGVLVGQETIGGKDRIAPVQYVFLYKPQTALSGLGRRHLPIFVVALSAKGIPFGFQIAIGRATH